MKKSLTVIGGGISGLSLAAFAHPHFSLQLLESSSKIGGIIQNSNEDGSVRDHAANGWLSGEESVEELLSLLQIQDQVITANTDEGTRWIVKNGRLFALNPKLLLSSLLSPLARLRLCAEPFIKAQSEQIEESLAEFGTRRLGKGSLDQLFTPFAAGIFACRPEELSVPAAFPRLWSMEQKHGSLLKAGLARDKSKPAPVLTTLRGGTSKLCESIASFLGDRVQLNTSALSVRKKGTRWIVETEQEEIISDYLAITCPAQAQARLFSQSFPAISDLMNSIPYSSAVVVIMEFNSDDFEATPFGFGALMNRQEQESGILGTLFTSKIFPSHQQKGRLSTRTIIGGSIRPEEIHKDSQDLAAMVIEHHRRLFGFRGDAPLHYDVIKHPMAIPRYQKGHLHIQQEIRAFHQHHPTLRLSGNHLFGVAVKDCIRQSKESVSDFISHQENHHA